MTANNSEILSGKVIKITQIDNPHKFWYKNANDEMQDGLLEQFERKIAEYVRDLLEWEEGQPKIKHGDTIAAYISDWKKWVRGVVGKADKHDDGPSTRMWAIDYGCILKLPTNDPVIPLKDPHLAYRAPFNVFVGCLSDIVPAKLVS